MTKTVFCIGNGQSRSPVDLIKLKPHGKIYGCNGLYRDFTPDVLCSVDGPMMHEIYQSGYCDNNETWFRDWNAIPGMTYDMVVYANLTPEEIDVAKKNFKIQENKREDRQEFVFHGSSISGQVGIIRRIAGGEQIEKKNISHTGCYVSWINPNDKSHSLKDLGDGKDKGWACGATSGKVALVIEQPEEIYLIGHDMVSNNNQVNNVYAGTKHYVAKENTPTPHTNWEQQWCNLIKEYPKVKFFKVNPNADRGPDKVSQILPLWQRFVQSGQVSYIDYPTLDKRLGL